MTQNKAPTITVAYVALAPFISGSERSLQQLLQHIELHPIRAVLICPPKSPLLTWASQRNIRCYEVDINYQSPKTNLFKYLRNQYQLFKIFKAERVVIAHSNQLWSYPAIAPLCKRLNIKTVCHFRDPLDENSNWWVNKQLDLALFISKHIESSFKQFIPTEKAAHRYTIINPVTIPDAQTELNLKQIKVKSLNYLGITPPAEAEPPIFNLGYIGQIAEVKGLIELITACAQLPSDNWQLIIAGEDPSAKQSYLKQCQAIARDLKISERVKFIGFVDDVAHFYHAVDVVMMLSKREPLGRVPLEAGAYYTPTIAHAVDGLPETIQDGNTGWLVEDIQAATVAKAIAYVMEIGDLSYIGHNARLWVEEISNPKQYATSIFYQYQKLIAEI